MAKLIETLMVDSASGENLDLEAFIVELRQNPDEWYAFRRGELVRFVDSILHHASLHAKESIEPPTHEQMRIYFGLLAEDSAK